MNNDTTFSTGIENVPAVRRVRLKHVGCWKELSMEFLSGLNIITEEDGGMGTSTILRAIVQGMHPSALEYPVSPTRGHLEGEVLVELMSPNIELRIAASQSVPSAPASDESMGRFSLRLLRSCIETAPPNVAVLIDDDVTGGFDRSAYAEAVNVLNAARCQVICVITHCREPSQFSQARIYACSWDQNTDSARMTLLQSGGG